MGIAPPPGCGDARPGPLDQPLDGDLVIVRILGSGVHSLAVRPSLPQILCDTRSEAVRQARRFAVRHAIDAWTCDEGGGYARVSHHRRATTRPVRLREETEEP
jgi:hypothetical protein